LKLDKTYGKGTVMKMGIEPLSKWKLFLGSLGIDLALELVVTQEEELLKYTAQNPLKDYIDTSCYCRSSKKAGIAAFIDAEHAFDRNYAEKLGVDIENLIISQPDNGEQALEIAENLIRSGAIDIVVIDSVAALTPKRSKVKWEILKWDFMHV
jgi:recombination protein RecA